MPTILLVEDDPAVSEVIEQHLSDAGFSVLAQRDTTSALERTAGKQQIDLLLVDLVMPTGQPDGLAFAEAVKARTPQLPIIFMTGYYGFVARSGPLPGRILYKPIDLDVLTREIELGLASHRH
jgi:CheY-like chemotaxis protein